MIRRRPPATPACRHLFPLQLAAAAALLLALLVVPAAALAQERPDRRQERPAGARVAVPPEKVEIDDGDTVTLLWGEGDRETVRILGIDAPEVRHDEHNIPFDQPFGLQAQAFCAGAFAAAGTVELLRAGQKDPYGRTLGYLFINGKNYSELILRAGLAVESVSQFGDNGFPEEAARMLQAARARGAVPFENPGDYRRRMRAVVDQRPEPAAR